MRRALFVFVPVLAMVACGGGRHEEKAGEGDRSSSADGRTAAASTPMMKRKIDVVLKWDGTKCVIEEPGKTVVYPGQDVRWRYKNKNGCKGKHTQRIVFTSSTPVDGKCENDIDVPEGQEMDGGDCHVDDKAPTGGKPYKYKIAGTVSLDPELDIQPPPPPPERQTTLGSEGDESTASAPVSGTRKIDVVMWWNGTKCVADDPGTTPVSPGQKVRWRYRNKGKPGKEKCQGAKTQRIRFKPGTPVGGDCKNDTVVGENQDNEGGDCLVDPKAPTNKPPYKYAIDGDVPIDPELDIQAPPFETKKPK